jgi:hypothetical protein
MDGLHCGPSKSIVRYGGQYRCEKTMREKSDLPQIKTPPSAME